MPKKSALDQVRKKFEAKTKQINREYEHKIRTLEDKISKNKKLRDSKLVMSRKEFRKDFCLTIKDIIGRDDYEWFIQWLDRNKEKEVKEAEGKSEKLRASKLRKMSSENYLFHWLSEPQMEKRLNKSRGANKQEDTLRLRNIMAMLKNEKAWIDKTLM